MPSEKHMASFLFAAYASMNLPCSRGSTSSAAVTHKADPAIEQAGNKAANCGKKGVP